MTTFLPSSEHAPETPNEEALDEPIVVPAEGFAIVTIGTVVSRVTDAVSTGDETFPASSRSQTFRTFDPSPPVIVRVEGSDPVVHEQSATAESFSLMQ
jgi:hypothetical protein